MSKLLKTINKFNGNLFIAAATDHGDIVIECDYHDRLLSYDYSTKLIKGICSNDDNSCLLVFGDNYIGKYSSGTLTENCCNTSVGNIHKMAKSTKSVYYLLNRTLNQLTRVRNLVLCDAGESSSSSESISIEWTMDLPDYDLRHEGDLLYRESDNTILYYNDVNIYLIRDDGNEGIVLNSLFVGNSGEIKALISSEFNATYSDVRARMIDGQDLEQSSSSSSSSTSSSSKSTSSSSSTSLSSLSSFSSRSSLSSRSSESSSSSYIENWSSSSESSSSGCFGCATFSREYCFTGSGFPISYNYLNATFTMPIGNGVAPYYECQAQVYFGTPGDYPLIYMLWSSYYNWWIIAAANSISDQIQFVGPLTQCDPSGVYNYSGGRGDIPSTVTVVNGACP